MAPSWAIRPQSLPFFGHSSALTASRCQGASVMRLGTSPDAIGHLAQCRGCFQKTQIQEAQSAIASFAAFWALQFSPDLASPWWNMWQRVAKRCYQVTSQHLCYGGRAIHRHPRGGQAQPCNGRAQVGTNRLHTFLTAVAMQPTLNPPFSPKKILSKLAYTVIWCYLVIQYTLITSLDQPMELARGYLYTYLYNIYITYLAGPNP